MHVTSRDGTQIAYDKWGKGPVIILVGGAELVQLLASPAWPEMLAIAPTLACDNAILGDDRTVPVAIAARVKAITLVMEGGASLGPMPFMRSTADKLGKSIPGAQSQVVEGKAHDVSPKVLAPILLKFFT